MPVLKDDVIEQVFLLEGALEYVERHLGELLVELLHEVGKHELHGAVLVTIHRRDVIEVDVDANLACV